MWQNWFSGILGLWIILLAFLDFSSTLTAFFLVASGLILAGLGFWSASLTKPPPKNPEAEIIPPTASSSKESEEQSSLNQDGVSSSQNNVP